jgi:hypothetical protein
MVEPVRGAVPAFGANVDRHIDPHPRRGDT